MLITTDQIRAARALLNWSQAELAKYSGLARPTIVKIETETQAPELKSLEKIISAFQTAGVEFGLDESVSRKNQDVKIYRGIDEFPKFFEELYNHVKASGGMIVVSNVDERKWVGAQGNFFTSTYAKNMTAIRDKIDFRILIREGDDYMPASPYATYRWVPEEHFATVPFHVYDDRFSIFLFLDEPIILSVRDRAAADIYREKFLYQWKNALSIPKAKKKKS